MARLLHYRALHEFNQHHDQAALDLLRAAEARYAALLPPEALHTRANFPGAFALGRVGTATVNNPVPNDDVVVDPAEQSALLGLVETRRYQAIVLREMGRPGRERGRDPKCGGAGAEQGMRQPVLTARLLRTAATSAAARGDIGDAASGLGLSSVAFGQALPGTRPLASTELLRAARLAQAGRNNSALASCRRAAALLRELKAGAPPELVAPCLDIYAAAASRAGSGGQAILAEMFEAAQQGQGNITSQQIARSTARLRENARDPRVGEAIRRRQDTGDRVAELTRQRDAAALRAGGTEIPGVTERLPPVSELDTALADARKQLADADTALQAASPNYGQLVQEVAPASDVFAALRPGRGVRASPSAETPAGCSCCAAAPSRVRAAGREPRADRRIGEPLPRQRGAGCERPAGHSTPPPRRTLYADTLGGLARVAGGRERAGGCAGRARCCPLPFAALLTGPADPDLAAAPWLVRQVAVAHVPAAGQLRLAAARSPARRARRGPGSASATSGRSPWRRRSAPSPAPACVESARLLAGLPPLPFARQGAGRRARAAGRLDLRRTARRRLHRADAVRQAPLKDYRILHFATHALLPAELRCQSEPAIVTSAPPGAPNASGALLTASHVSALDLDADAGHPVGLQLRRPRRPGGRKPLGAGARLLLRRRALDAGDALVGERPGRGVPGGRHAAAADAGSDGGLAGVAARAQNLACWPRRARSLPGRDRAPVLLGALRPDRRRRRARGASAAVSQGRCRSLL